VAAIFVLGGTLCAISACVDRMPSMASASEAPACRPGRPECPIAVTFIEETAAATAVVEGSLSPAQNSVSLAFHANAGARLRWALSGPAVHVVLTGPDGQADGPGLPPEIALPTAGRYIFSLSSNTMAEGIYGPFRLELRLLPAR